VFASKQRTQNIFRILKTNTQREFPKGRGSGRCIWEDVTFNINGSERATVAEEIFQERTKLALELDAPSEIISDKTRKSYSGSSIQR